MNKIFVSYRREDSQDITGRITDHLAERFGVDRLFKDVDSIPFGEDFRAVIADALSECDLLLAIIGSDWMAKDETGKGRIDDPQDYVRTELRVAIERGIPIIPVLVDNSQMPKAELLPADLRAISFKNAVAVRPDPDFKSDVERLTSHLEKRLAPKSFLRRRAVVVGVPIAILLLLLAAVFALGFRPPATAPTKLRVGLKQWVGYTPLAVAKEMGLFPQGVDVHYQDVESVADMHTKLVNGEIDIALSLVESHVRATEIYQNDSANENRPVVFLKMDTSRGADGIIALREVTNVTQLGKLEGGEERRFLYQHHDVSHFLFMYLCKSEAAVNADIRWSDLKDYGHNVNPEAAAELFAHPTEGKYFAAGTYEPHLTTLRETVEGAHVLIDSDSEGVSGLVVDVMVTKQKFLDQNRNAILSLLDGWFAAVEILNDNSHPRHTEAVDLAYRFNGTPQDSKEWSVATWLQNEPCEQKEYEDYIAGLTGKSRTAKPWPDKKENIEFFKRPGGAPSRFHVVFQKCMELRQGRNLSRLDAASFDGSAEVFFRD